MSADELGLLLRFVTSVSRAPLGGFRHLAPPLTIHRVPCDASPFAAVGARDVDRLPSASTCFNLLARSRWVGAWPCISACWRSPTGSGYGCGFTRGRVHRGGCRRAGHAWLTGIMRSLMRRAVGHGALRCWSSIGLGLGQGDNAACAGAGVMRGSADVPWLVPAPRAHAR